MVNQVAYRKFGETRLVPLDVRVNNRPVPDPENGYEAILWIERDEDTYAMMYDSRRFLVVFRDVWLNCPPAPLESNCNV